MKYVEDFLEALAQRAYRFSGPNARSRLSDWDNKFVLDVSTHTLAQNALSEAQAEVTLKILRRYHSVFKTEEQSKLNELVKLPVYRNPLVKSDRFPREVRWAGGSVLLFRSPYNSAIIDELKQLQTQLGTFVLPRPIPGKKMWRVILDQNNYKSVMNFIRKHNFDFDQEVLEQFLKIENEQNEKSSVQIVDDKIEIQIKNDLLASMWLDFNEWIENV